MGYETVFDALDAEGLVVGGSSFSDQAFRCPAHDDRTASGSIREGDDGRALLFCHAGCEAEEIIDALGLEMKDLFVGDRTVEAEYVYSDADGRPLYRVVRFSPKGFTQERYTGSDVGGEQYSPGLSGMPRVLYNLGAVLRATDKQRVYVVEGEKDADRLNALGEVATCNVGGASQWRPEWAESLRGKDVVIVPDNDEPGIKHARAIQDSLDGVANSVRVKYAARGKDVSDHLDAGFSLSELVDEPSPEEAFSPLDWETYQAPDVEWLMEPYFPTHGRVLVFGKAGSLKSLWVMWVAAKLARQGKKIAYFSLEMRPEQTVARLKKLNPPKHNFKVYTKYRMGDKNYLKRTVDALRGYDMIVVDSWNAAYRFTKGGTHDDQVAELDDEFFQPIINQTGATLVIIDNTGHDLVVGFGNKVASEHARGSSAKGDKMDVTILLTRPDEDNNFMTEIHVKKMRYEIPIPAKRVVCAPAGHDGIDFFDADPITGDPLTSMWKEEVTLPDGGYMDERMGSERNTEENETEVNDAGTEDQVRLEPLPSDVDERLAFVRAQRILDELKYAEVPEGASEAAGDDSG